MHFHTRPLALVLSLVLSAAAPAQTPDFEYRWSGLVFDVHAPTTNDAFTVEDGGRIRRTSNKGVNWSFDETPITADHILRGIHVLSDLSKGWAVGENSTILHNSDVLNSTTWTKVGFGLQPAGADLYDVFFADALNGWLLGKHNIWYSTDGGLNWAAAIIKDDAGMTLTTPDLADIELYAMDIKPGLTECIHLCGCTGFGCTCPLTPTFGLACAEPGFIYRTTDGITWKEVFDILDYCPFITGTPFCAVDKICNASEELFEPWDIEISDHPTDPLAIMVGGVGPICGLIFTSADWGCTWTQELHECDANPGCNPTADITADPPEPLDSFRTLYGVAINSTDNSAIACGYNGQHLRRPTGAPGTVVWDDRSVFGDIYKVPHNGAVVFPLFGAEFSPDLGSGVTGYIVGLGGHVRTTTDGGLFYTEHGSAPGDFRIRDAQFINDANGTLTGQFFLLAATTDGALFWKPRTHIIGKPALNALAFAGDGFHGVAVGQIDPVTSEPKIKYTSDSGATWNDATLPAGVDQPLNAVAWDKGSLNKTFWAVGNSGLILETTDGGMTWTTIPSPTVGNFLMKSVAFASPVGVAVVGKKAGKGTAFTRVNGNWTDISPDGALNVRVITGVDAIGSVVYAVGAKVTGNGREGTVMKLGASKLEEVPNSPFVPLCPVGAAADDTEPLNAVKLVVAIPNNVFVAGQCGVLWELAGGVWTRRRSETSSHIRNLSVVSSGRVYAAAWGNNEHHSCITRLK